MTWYFQWEFAVLDFIYEHHAGWLDPIMKGLSFLGEVGWIWIASAIVLLCISRYRKTGLKMILSLALMLIIGNGILKPLVARIRPYDINTAIVLLGEKLSDYSFPSGHTYASFAAAVILLINHKKIGIPALILAFAIAFSRLYLYVHYPTDILAGMVLGIITAFIANGIVEAIQKKLKNKKL